MAIGTGWTCIYCGQEVEGPVNDHVCPEGTEFPSNEEYVTVKLDGVEYPDKVPAPRRERTAEQKAERLASMPLRPGETQEARDASVENLRNE